MSTTESRSLLRIDFAAALAKLAPAQLEGSWQLPTELVRLALASGAKTVEVRLAADRIELLAEGARLAPGTVRDLGHILDQRQPVSDRHQALVSLEQHDALALAALASYVRRSVWLTSGGQGGIAMEAGPGTQSYVNKDSDQLELVAEGLDLNVRAAGEWLQRKGRFSRVPIIYQGKEIYRGFYSPLIQNQLLQPISARLAITSRGDAPRLWLLRHGIVSTRATVPGFPAFEAAVEMAPLAKPEVTGAALREEINPYLDSLINASVGLTLKLSKKLAKAPPEVRERTARLLLEAERRGRFSDTVRAANIFYLALADGRRQLVSIAEVLRRAKSSTDGPIAVEALMPEMDPEDFAVPDDGVLVLSASERALLGEVTGVSFTLPAARPRRRRSPQRLAAAAVGRLAFTWYRLCGGLVPQDQLTPEERNFVESLTADVGPGWPRQVVFRRGGADASRVFATLDGDLLLPRESPRVQAAVQAIARDGTWLYPVLLSLYGGHEPPAADLRRRWRERASGVIQAP